MSLRILFLSEYYPPFAPGGAEWSLLRLAQALAGRGHEIHIVTPYLGETTLPDPPGVYVHRFPFRHRLKGGNPLSPYVIATPFFYSRFLRHALDYAKGHSFDLVHAQNVHSMPVAAAMQTRIGLPAIMTVRDYRMLCPSAICLLEEDDLVKGCGISQYQKCLGKYPGIYGKTSLWSRAKFRVRRTWEYVDWKIRRHFFRSLTGIVFVGERIRQIHQRAGIVNEEMVSIPNLPPETVVPHQHPEEVLKRLGLTGKRIILHAGRVSVGKGGRLLAEAFSRLTPDDDVVLALAGRVELNDEVPKKITGRYLLLGQLSHEDLSALYESAEMFVTASVWQEPFSRSILEAMQYGLPVVATDAGGNAEIVQNGETGFVVKRSDPEALANAIQTLLLHREQGKQMGAAGRKLLDEQYFSEALLDRLEEYYGRFVKRES